MHWNAVIWALGAAALAGCAPRPATTRVILTETEPGEVAVVQHPTHAQPLVAVSYSDDQIEDAVEQAFKYRGDIDTSDIDIDVENGEVILKGDVDNYHDIEEARQIALGVPGVRAVNVTDLEID
jgi:osmotically-inducible protein OsmY